MLFRCKVRNGKVWTEVEVVGEEFEKAFKRRFGTGLDCKDIEVFDEVKNEWVKIERRDDRAGKY